MADPTRVRSDAWIVAGVVALFASIAGSMAYLSSYKSTEGERGSVPAKWPGASRIARDGRPTLIMFAHPMCPCTRASLAELRELVSEIGTGAAVHVLFGIPDGAGEDWREGELWRSASSIGAIQVRADEGEQEARRFGARTSGHVMLYDAAGRLLYSGGITRSRGHSGKSVGRAQLALLVKGERGEIGGAPVFGCPLEDPR